jgi:hypothetical protein
MNIHEAKEYIKNSIQLYLKKDEFGDYRIPVVRQRPVFLLGAPGIGKTAIMEQIASEMGIALVSYSMTHHTRQSALGLPFIAKRSYGGKEYDVSEYTMSEIIASIYETMEESGVKEGILFLDEINCVSETLAPAMLQFLQYKVFGRHRVPEGWVIVTAGNPPEYNKSVREFDVVTLDRLKVLPVEADYGTWKLYAREKNIHGAVLNFLESRQDYFYHMETVAANRGYVTARGWEDLSEILKMYEEEGLPIREALIGQYLHSETVVKEFAAYYDLYNKYKNDYQLEQLLTEELDGTVWRKAVLRIKQAELDERLSLLGILLDAVMTDMKNRVEEAEDLQELSRFVKKLSKEEADMEALLRKELHGRRASMEQLERASTLSQREKQKTKRVLRFLESRLAEKSDYDQVLSSFKQETAHLKQRVGATDKKLNRLFAFTEEAFQDGNEMLVLLTELTVSKSSTRYLSMFGNHEYQKYSQSLLLSERRTKIQENIEKLGLFDE